MVPLRKLPNITYSVSTEVSISVDEGTIICGAIMEASRDCCVQCKKIAACNNRRIRNANTSTVPSNSNITSVLLFVGRSLGKE